MTKVELKSIKSQIPAEALQILEEGFFAYLGTANRSCVPHITTMFYLWDSETMKVFLITAETSKKVRNVKQNNKVSITVDVRDPVSPEQNRGVLIRGRARIISIEKMGDVRLNRYMERYLSFLGTGFPMGSRVVIEVTPRILNYWRGVRFFRWKNPKFKNS
jgi:nitroimidazol reductase NimA-like FMN-containing flavoprotein (pyridoxamine 5'-phosphate oxidase superfamily)